MHMIIIQRENFRIDTNIKSLWIMHLIIIIDQKTISNCTLIMVGLLNQALLGKWLLHFRKEYNRLGLQVIATKYGVARRGWCTRGVRGTHECRTWKNIRAGAKSFFGQVVYATGDGHCIRFWHDPWSGHIPL